VAELMVVGLLVGAKVDEYVERTEPEEFRVLEAGGEVVSLLRLERHAQWWLGRALPSAQVHQLATPPQHRGAAPYRARPASLEEPAELAAVYRRVAPSRGTRTRPSPPSCSTAPTARPAGPWPPWSSAPTRPPS